VSEPFLAALQRRSAWRYQTFGVRRTRRGHRCSAYRAAWTRQHSGAWVPRDPPLTTRSLGARELEPAEMASG
jgi:hypothetical protein